MFTSIAGAYDLNNTLLSFGLHYYWKKITASFITPVGRGTALDVGSGTADLALLIESRMGPKGRVIASDLNHAMLAEGLKKISDKGLGEKSPACRPARNISDSVTTPLMRSPPGSACETSEICRKPYGKFVG